MGKRRYFRTRYQRNTGSGPGQHRKWDGRAFYSGARQSQACGVRFLSTCNHTWRRLRISSQPHSFALPRQHYFIVDAGLTWGFSANRTYSTSPVDQLRLMGNRGRSSGRSRGLGANPASGEHFADHISSYARKPGVHSGIEVRQPGMIEAHQMQYSGVKIGNVAEIFDGAEAEFISRTYWPGRPSLRLLPATW